MDQQPPWSVDVDTSHKTTIVGPDVQQELHWDNLHLADDQRWQLARRIAASSSFARSTLLSNFLLYVCDRALNGKTDDISGIRSGYTSSAGALATIRPKTISSEAMRGIYANAWIIISRRKENMRNCG